MKAGLLSIGNELLRGKTVNSNAAWIGKSLSEIGLAVNLTLTVADEAGDIRDGLDFLWDRCEVVCTTGGLGPTRDDITKKCIAERFGSELEFREELWQELIIRFRNRGIDIPKSNRTQAEIPTGFTALFNPYGTAPGLQYETDGKILFILPGVPHEMKAIFEGSIKPILQKKYPATRWISRELHTAGIAESALADRLEDLSLPDGIELAWLPQPGRVTLRISGTDSALIESCIRSIKDRVGALIWGEDDDSPASVLFEKLRKRDQTVAFAESCTGGLTQKMFTDIPGVSVCFEGGVVTYSNRMKKAMLGVSGALLENHGAVSAEVAEAMSKGLHRLTGADFCGAITGIAGPDGGTEDKPVGTVYIAVTDPRGTVSEHLRLKGDRGVVRLQSAERLFKLINKRLMSQDVNNEQGL